MGIYIVVNQANGLIDNRIDVDDIAAWPVPDGHVTYEDVNQSMAIGGTYINGVYTAPPPLPIPLDANGRLDAGISASIAAAENVRNSIHAIPSGFTAANFQAFLVQAKILSDAFVAMLEAQQTPAAPP